MEHKMNTFKKGLLAGAAALTLSMTAQAGNINVGGVIWDPEDGADFSSNTSLVEDQLNFNPAAGPIVDELTGFGIVNIFNGDLVGDFCPGCELTFQFGGFVVDNPATDIVTGDFDLLNAGLETFIGFTGGWINFYIDDTADYDSEVFASAGSEGAANALFLRLEAHEVFNAILGKDLSIGSILSSFGIGSDKGVGSSLMDAVSGLAFENFDTNEEADGADITFTSSFHPYSDQSQADVNGGYELFGSADLSGNSIGIPEPSTIALLGLGLLGFAGARKRKA